jgi:hypothetical protein
MGFVQAAHTSLARHLKNAHCRPAFLNPVSIVGVEQCIAAVSGCEEFKAGIAFIFGRPFVSLRTAPGHQAAALLGIAHCLRSTADAHQL